MTERESTLATKKKISMKDIAEMAKVSKGAVSQILDHKGSFSQEVRDRVFELCDKHNYRRNPNIQAIARSGKTTRNRHIAFAMIAASSGDAVYANMQMGVGRAAAQRNHIVSHLHLSGEEKRITDFPSLIYEKKVDGLVLTGPVSEAYAKIIARLEIPTVLVGAHSDYVYWDMPIISSHVAKAVEKAVFMAKEMGRSRPALFVEDDKSVYRQLHIQAFKKAAEDQGLAIDENSVILGQGLAKGSLETLGPIFQKEKLPFDVLFLSDLRIAYEVACLAWGRFGLTKSDEFIIASPCRHGSIKIPYPAIHIDFRMDEVAHEGAKVLIESLEGEASLMSNYTLVQPDLQFRD